MYVCVNSFSTVFVYSHFFIVLWIWSHWTCVFIFWMEHW